MERRADPGSDPRSPRSDDAISPFAAYQGDVQGQQAERADARPSAQSDARMKGTVAPLTTAALTAASTAAPSPRGAASSSSTHPCAASRYLFSKLCTLFEGILGAVNKAQQYALLEAFWQSLPRDEPFFPFMRLLMPHLDTVRPLYQLRESKLARLYVEALGLHERSGAAQRLLQWKDPRKSSVETTSFSDVVFVTLLRKGGFQRRHLLPPPGHSTPATTTTAAADDDAGSMTVFTVESVNAFLDRLAAAETTGERQQLLMESLQRTTPLEQKWLIRIILKDMKFRMTHQTLLTAFHPTALDKYNATSDLAYVCEACLEDIRQPTPGSSAAGIFLFQPLRPMLASPVTAKKLEQMLAAGGIVLEPKYDGERIMVHVDAQKIMYWTRNAKNYTALYGPKCDATVRSAFVVGSQVNIPHVKNLNAAESVDEAHEGVVGQHDTRRAGQGSLVTLDNAIFDGELLLYDSGTKSFIPFGMNRSFATSGGAFPTAAAAVAATAAEDVAVDGSERWFCYMVFDIVFLNGKSLMHLPLSARRGILRCVLHECHTKIEVVPAHEVTSSREILSWLQRMVDADLEGVVLKACDSSYTPAERKNKWVKLKTDHIAGLADTVDLVVVGGYHGTKFGSRHISHFLMATWVNESSRTPHDAEAKFRTVCKIGNGFNSEELSSMQAMLEPHWETMPSRATVPAWLDGWKPVGSDLIPDVYVHPTRSIVLEVYGYAFVQSANYGVKYTIRFPRMLRVRFDKSLDDATDLRTLGRIKEASKDALRRRAAEGHHDGEDELLTVMSMKWKRRRDERLGANSLGQNDDGSLQQQAPYPAASPMPLSLRGGHVAQWALASSARAADAARWGGPVPASLPTRTIGYVSRTLGVTRLAAHEAILDELFAGYEFCVLFTSEETCTVRPEVTGNRTALERCLLQHGAKVVANMGRQTSLLLASSRAAPRVVNWVNLCRSRPAEVERKYAATDVVHCDWAMACVEAGSVMPLTPRFVLYASPGLEAKFRLLLDPFEDSYYEPASVESLAYSVEQARKRSRATSVGSPSETSPPEAAEATADSLVENTNAVYELEKELGILPDGAMHVAAVHIPTATATAAPEQGEWPSSPLVPLLLDSEADTAGGGGVWVTDRIAAHLLDRKARARPTEKAATAESEAVQVKVEAHSSSTDGQDTRGLAHGASPMARRGGTSASVTLSACVPLLLPAQWTVPQFLAMLQLMSGTVCRVAATQADIASVTHVVDRSGRLLKALPG